MRGKLESDSGNEQWSGDCPRLEPERKGERADNYRNRRGQNEHGRDRRKSEPVSKPKKPVYRELRPKSESKLYGKKKYSHVGSVIGWRPLETKVEWDSRDVVY